MWEKIPDIKFVDDHLKKESGRLKVPGGWLVRTVVTAYNSGTHSSQTFITDPQHEWVLEQ